MAMSSSESEDVDIMSDSLGLLDEDLSKLLLEDNEVKYGELVLRIAPKVSH